MGSAWGQLGLATLRECLLCEETTLKLIAVASLVHTKAIEVAQPAKEYDNRFLGYVSKH